jgi:hypothetical protein
MASSPYRGHAQRRMWPVGGGILLAYRFVALVVERLDHVPFHHRPDLAPFRSFNRYLSERTPDVDFLPRNPPFVNRFTNLGNGGATLTYFSVPAGAKLEARHKCSQICSARSEQTRQRISEMVPRPGKQIQQMESVCHIGGSRQHSTIYRARRVAPCHPLVHS